MHYSILEARRGGQSRPFSSLRTGSPLWVLLSPLSRLLLATLLSALTRLLLLLTRLGFARAALLTTLLATLILLATTLILIHFASSVAGYSA
jgi:hypothetical protein